MPKGAMERYATALETARTRLEELYSRESDNPLSDITFSANLESRIPELQLRKLQSQLGNPESRLAEAKKDYHIALRKYRLAYDKILNKSTLPGINLLKEENRKIIEEALLF